MSSTNSTNKKTTIALLVTISLIAVTPAVALAGEMIVTGLSGQPRANGVSLLMHDRLSERAEAIELETSRVSSVSVLYGDSISLQLGPSTKVLINPATDQRGELIELVRGELRSTTRRDGSKKRPEIHTPSAVIRPSTTTLHVLVDAVSGDTEATSLESRAWVVSSDPANKQSAILNSQQQLTIHTGSPPGTIRKFVPNSRGEITGFVAGKMLREAALTHDLKREGHIALSQIALNDVPNTTLPSVASPFPTPHGLGWGDHLRPGEVLCEFTTECRHTPAVPPSRPPVCTGSIVGGEHCQSSN